MTAQAVHQETRPPDPAAVMRSRRWWRRDRPFAHFVATDVFTPDFYAELEEAFRGILARGLGEAFRHSSGYDAYIHHLAPDIDGPLSFFVSHGWHDLLASVADVRVTNDVSVALHHHEPGSRDGTVHNDLNPGWFPATAGTRTDVSGAIRADGINCVSSDLCDYKHGTPHAPGITPVERTRAVAMIYFLNNAPWKNGNGGECALYAHRSAAAAQTIAPVSNSLLLFECTPWSYHRFLSNRVGARDSVILWLHREREHAVTRWGERSIVRWSR
jgi:hypothetical protein